METFGSEARIGPEVYTSPKKQIETNLIIIMAVLGNDDPKSLLLQVQIMIESHSLSSPSIMRFVSHNGR